MVRRWQTSNDGALLTSTSRAAGRSLLPVVVAVAQRSNRDGEGLPRRIQRVLDHLRLVTDGEPGRGTRRHEEETRGMFALPTLRITRLSESFLRHASSRGRVYLQVCSPGGKTDDRLVDSVLFCADNPSEAEQ